MVLGAIKDGRLRLPPLRGAFGILDRSLRAMTGRWRRNGRRPAVINPASGGSSRRLLTGRSCRQLCIHVVSRSQRQQRDRRGDAEPGRKSKDADTYTIQQQPKQ